MTTNVTSALLRARWVVTGALLIAMASLALSEAVGTRRSPAPVASATAGAQATATQSVPPTPKTAARPMHKQLVPPRAPVRSPDDLPDTVAGRRLRTYLEAAGAGGDDADQRAQDALEALRGAGHAATELVTETYDALPEHRYLARWMMIDTLSDLGDHEALDELREIAESPIPKERLSGGDEGHGQPSSVAEEVKIRSAAVRGVAALAELGNRDAEQGLRDIAAHADEAVREKAALAYVELGVDRRARKTEMMSILPPSDQWMARVPVIPVEHLPPLAPPPSPATANRAPPVTVQDAPTTPIARQDGK